MKIIIMGCGKVGTQVSRLMAAEGHEVTVIDPDPTALARLGPEFKGRRLTGVGFDRKVLLDAGIEQAEAFAATSTFRQRQHRGGADRPHDLPRPAGRLPGCTILAGPRSTSGSG